MKKERAAWCDLNFFMVEKEIAGGEKERELLGFIYVTRYGCHLQTLHLILLAFFLVLITLSVTPKGHLDRKNTTFFEMVSK
jgi:dolichol kinase